MEVSITTLKLLELEEGYRERAYYCSEGYPTIGIGKKIGRKNQPLSDFELITVPKCVAYAWLECEVDGILNRCESEFHWFSKLNQARQDVVISMCYQLGFDGFSKFKKTIKLISGGHYESASYEMLDSAWASQTPERAGRHSHLFCCGDWYGVAEYENIGD